MKHTKGPWRTEQNPSNLGQWIVIAATHQTVIHQVAGGKDHAEANARLIAAAPDLLKALMRLRPLIWEDIKRGHGLFSDEDLAVVDVAIEKAKADSITVADGRETK